MQVPQRIQVLQKISMQYKKSAKKAIRLLSHQAKRFFSKEHRQEEKLLAVGHSLAIILNSHYSMMTTIQLPERRRKFTSNYYQSQHETNKAFAENNWLVEEVSTIRKINPSIITELACGNGDFAKIISSYCNKVYAIDWAQSPRLHPLPKNVKFKQLNIVEDAIPSADLCCSADFLEHLPEIELDQTINKIIHSAQYGYHKIACYDDGHSHLSILPPWKWLEIFRRQGGKDYNISKLEFRRSDLSQIVIVISNINAQHIS